VPVGLQVLNQLGERRADLVLEIIEAVEDGVHAIDGGAWQEFFCALPKSVQLFCLSASVSMSAFLTG
jgi:hypothetical protein